MSKCATTLEKILVAILMAISAMVVVALLTGCGSIAERQEKSVARTQYKIPGVAVHTWLGDVNTDPVVVTVTDEKTIVSQETKTIDDPVTPIIQAASGAFPWGGIVSTGITGLIAALAGKKALDNRRRFNEVVDGIESAKNDLGPKWDVLTKKLSKKQSADTKIKVKDRVG